MKPMRLSMAAALIAACCASSLAAGQTEAQPANRGQEAAHDHEAPGPGAVIGRDDGPRHGPGHGFDGRGHEAGFLPFAARLQLSEAQQDKLFAIRHAAAPQRRQQEKAIRHAHEDLRALGASNQFDDTRAGAAARELGQAIAAKALLETRLHAQMLAVLTPEQRERLRERRQRPPQGRP